MENKRIYRPPKLHCDKPGIDCDTCICDMIVMEMRYYDVIDGIKGPHLLHKGHRPRSYIKEDRMILCLDHIAAGGTAGKRRSAALSDDRDLNASHRHPPEASSYTHWPHPLPYACNPDIRQYGHGA